MEEKKEIDGVIEKREENWAIYYVTELTDSLKDNIRKNLTAICEGPDTIDDSYEITAKEFITRCESTGKQQEKRIVGMIGEFLVHLIILKYYNYIPASILFNLEEKSFKKGFDLLLYQSNESKLWITEVKSGKVSVSEKADGKMGTLIERAKTDLRERLNNKDQKQELWRNAFFHAKNAIDESKSERDAIIDLIKDSFAETKNKPVCSIGDNVVLSGVLFHPLEEKAAPTIIKGKQEKICQEKYNNDILFKNVVVLAIQEKTCYDVLNFLKDEVNEQ